jgi:phosphoribosylglycinamide formyltransferase 2
MKKILLLGSGELGKEFVISAKAFGLLCHCLRQLCRCAPAMQVADECEIFSMLDEAPLRAAIAKHKPDLIHSRN